MINSEALFSQYDCNLDQEVFDIGIEYLSIETNIKVLKTSTITGEEEELILGVNYTVDVSTDEVSTAVDAESPYSADYKLTILLDVPYTQLTDIVSNSNYDPEVLESTYDKNTLLSKQLKEEVSRTVKLSQSDTGTEMILPPQEELKNGVLGFDSTGAVQVKQGFVPSNYTDNITYFQDEIIQYGGYFFICLQDSLGNEPTGETGVDMYWRMVRIGGIPYDPNFYYLADDVVSYSGMFYLALTNSHGAQPDISDTEWGSMTYAAEDGSVIDAGGHYTESTIENVLQEIGDALNLKLSISAATENAEVKTLKINTTGDSAATLGEATIKWNSDLKQIVVSDGAEFHRVGSRDIGLGITFDNPDMQSSIFGYIAYKDAAAATPEDGWDGTPVAVSALEETTDPLIGTRSLSLSKSAVNGQGEGISYDFTVDEGMSGRILGVALSYKVSTNYVSGDIGIYVYDLDNATLLTPYVSDISDSTDAERYVSSFVASDSENYRLIFHVKTTNASAYTMLIDKIDIGSWEGSNQVVSENDPDGNVGTDGDFWYKYEE